MSRQYWVIKGGFPCNFKCDVKKQSANRQQIEKTIRDQKKPTVKDKSGLTVLMAQICVVEPF